MFRFLVRAVSALGVLVLPLWAAAQAGVGQSVGERVYRETCLACHGSGAANAPRFEDKKAWAKLIKEGQVPLTVDGWVGVRGMPAKGGRADLSLEDFARATVWMANAAGAKWQDPDAKMLQAMQAREAKRLQVQKK
ncbi:MAG: hypothetical protein RL468_2165 [Pseudomonadota bacterium]|jgi:cytochrome c5